MFHIEGYNLSIGSFDDNYELLDELEICGGDINESDPTKETVPKVSVQIYECPKECTLEEAKEYSTMNMFGSVDIETQDYGYSEYTITGFSVYSMKLGGHDIGKIIENKSKKNKYLHVVIEKR